MDRQEFITQLRQSLNGRIDAEQVSDNVRYYEEYIDSQLRQGRNEAEVMTSLGSPRLIARSITDAWMQGAPEEPATYRGSEGPDQGGFGRGEEAYDRNGERRYDSGQSRNGEQRYDSGQSWNGAGWNGDAGKLSWLIKFFKMPRWLRYVVGFGVLFLVLAIVLSILQFFAPVILMFVVATFLVKLFRDWLN